MAEISFTIPGIPAPQGSKTRTKWGVREDNPATRPWRSAVAWEATAAMRTAGLDALLGPLELTVSFYFPRPKNHYGTGTKAETLKPTAPHFHTSKPDVDKLVRAIGDSLSGIVCRDDSQLARIVAEKNYGHPRATVVVRELLPTSGV